MVKLSIDGINVSVESKTTILDAAKKAGINIPTLCYLKDINEIGACRLCVVEVEGIERCLTACNNIVLDGMVVKTNTKKVITTRENNLKLILSQHDFNCATCIRNGCCKLQKLAEDFGVLDVPFDVEYEKNNWDKKYVLQRNNSKCIKCMRCVQVCDKIQTTSVWDVVNTGSKTSVNTKGHKEFGSTNCVYCGQCVIKCPVGALHERDDIKKVLELKAQKGKINIVQVAPAVRTSYGELLGIDKKIATEKKLAGILKFIGFDYVFDTVFTADMTIMEEGTELLKRLENNREKKLPMFTSCCPGWVNFVKNEFPELLPQLSTARSPQGMLGAIAKSYYAEYLKVNKEDINVISIMPCLAKKDEITWDDTNNVDVVLTTRELVRLIKLLFIDINKIEEKEFDIPFGIGTGAGLIFGSTGGVMEAALRSAYYLLNKKNPSADYFKDVRGLDGYKEGKVDLGGTVLNVAVVSGLSNARKLIKQVLNREKIYDFVEVMACPSGCVNGGGQPINIYEQNVKERSDYLYELDKNNKIRFSHENPQVIDLYKNYFIEPLSNISHKLLHIEHKVRIERS